VTIIETVLLVDRWEQKLENLMMESSIRIKIVTDAFLVNLKSTYFCCRTSNQYVSSSFNLYQVLNKHGLLIAIVSGL